MVQSGESMISAKFNKSAADDRDAFMMLPETPFVEFLINRFGDETAENVLSVFEKMELPPPEDWHEFLDGTEGGLVFLNRYGLVLRIEDKKSLKENWGRKGIKDTPWILKSVASMDVGKAVIEICPGCHLGKSYQELDFLKDHLRAQKIDFWDAQFANFGIMPIKTPSFPEGIPVVIDRGAVESLTFSVKAIGAELQKKNAQEAAQAQASLYDPLRQAFSEAWKDTGKMRQFWDLCRRYVREEKLIAGWEEAQAESYTKTGTAERLGRAYEDRLKSADQAVNSASAAIPLSPRSRG